MASILKSFIGGAFGWAVVAGSALANTNNACGGGFPGAPACTVPEPGTWALVGLGIAGAVLAAKFGKRK